MESISYQSSEEIHPDGFKSIGFSLIEETRLYGIREAASYTCVEKFHSRFDIDSSIREYTF